MPCFTLKDATSFGLRQLALPDFEITAVCCDVQGHVAETRAADIVGNLPLHFKVGTRSDATYVEVGLRRGAIETLVEHLRIFGRLIIEENASARCDAGASRQIWQRLY